MDFKAIAQQLRYPEGEMGKQVGIKMSEGNAFICQLAIESLELDPNDQVLEIGMGTGAFVKEIFLKESSIKYIGCDFSETMVEAASNINKELIETGQVQFVVSSLENLPFPAESFHTAFTVNTIYFWDNPEKELGEIKRVLKKNGKLLVALRPKSIMQDMPFTQYDFNLYEKSDVENLLTRNGFVVTKTIHKEEPTHIINDVIIKMETLIIIAQKQ